MEISDAAKAELFQKALQQSTEALERVRGSILTGKDATYLASQMMVIIECNKTVLNGDFSPLVQEGAENIDPGWQKFHNGQ